MLTANEYVEIKARMLLAAEAAALIARSPDAVRFDDEMFPVVMKAMAMNKEDVRRIFADGDILRHMADQKIFPTIIQGVVAHAGVDEPNGERTVDAVQIPANETSGEQIPDDGSGDGGDVPTGGADEVGEEVPKPRRNRGRKKRDSSEVG